MGLSFFREHHTENPADAGFSASCRAPQRGVPWGGAALDRGSTPQGGDWGPAVTPRAPSSNIDRRNQRATARRTRVRDCGSARAVRRRPGVEALGRGRDLRGVELLGRLRQLRYVLRARSLAGLEIELLDLRDVLAVGV